MKMRYIVLGVLLVLFLAWIAFGYFSVAKIERLSYVVLEDDKEYEVRQIDDHIVAEVVVSGDYRKALNDGFRQVADYIFGNNKKNEPVAMTTPVINSEDESEVIAMTTPVINSGDEESKDRFVAFVVPAKYTLDTLPEPNNKDVKLREVKGEKVAVLEFTWWATGERVEAKKEELKKYLERDGLKVESFKSALYNPPLTPPFMLRNEVWAVLSE